MGQAVIIDSLKSKKKRPVRFGEWLVREELVSDATVRQALDEQSQQGGRLGEVLCRQAVWTEEQKVTFLARFLDIPQWSMESLAEVDMSVAQSIPERVARRNRLIPIHGRQPLSSLLN